MADERTKAPYNQKSPVPEKYSWPSLIKKNGDELFDQFSGSHCPALARKPSPRLLPRPFGGTEVQWTSATLRRLVVDLIDKEQCVSMSADVKGYACIVNGVF